MNSRLQKTGASRLAGLVLLLVMVTPMHTAFAKVNAGTDGVAIHGFDVVAYFLEGRAVRGTSEFEHSWQDAKWQFSSAANKDLFAANPERYAPQYGGYCAVCLALDGELTDANPKAWTIVEGKLYLNYSMHQRTQWRIKSNIYVKFGDEVWTELIARDEKRGATDASYRLAVIGPFNPGADTRQLQLGADIYKSILVQPSFSITYADEPYDPSALSYLNRGGDWPYPSTNLELSEVWQGPPRSGINNTPRFDRLYQAGQDLEVDAVLMWNYRYVWGGGEWPAEIYVIDVDKQRTYRHKGTNNNVNVLVQQALEDFRAGREGYRIAVIEPYSPSKDTRMLVLGGEVYKSIRQHSAFSITHADEPMDPSARSSVNRGGDWPFPPANVDPKEAWQGDLYYKTLNLDWLYGVGKELGVDILMTWYYKADQHTGQWPVEVYVIDIKKQRVYVQKGTNNETSRLVAQALSDFVTGRKP